MQLQGRYNNPSFVSGYNYKNTWHALQMIIKHDGFAALYQGYRATLMRDVPFSALQFAFYGKDRVPGSNMSTTAYAAALIRSF
jgi:hypothetical protein